MWLIYNVLMTLLAPIWLPMAWIKSRKRKEQPNWRERFGSYGLPPAPSRALSLRSEIAYDFDDHSGLGHPDIGPRLEDAIVKEALASGTHGIRLTSGPDDAEVSYLQEGAWRAHGKLPHEVAALVRQRLRLHSNIDLLARTSASGRMSGKFRGVPFAFDVRDEYTADGFVMRFECDPSSVAPAVTGGPRGRIWFHAVSVGEAVASGPILRELRRALPSCEIVLSVTTSSGHQTAREKLSDLYDHLVYFPFDLPPFQMRAMRAVRPDLVLVMETELWMNFLWAAKRVGAKTALVNGRISNRSYPRARKLRPIFAGILSFLDVALMQSEVDRKRILDLGARAAYVVGNCKFDQAVEGLDADPIAWRRDLGLDPDRPTIVVGSTRGEMEERFVAEALATLGPDRVNLVYAPRHLERASQVADEFRRIGVEFRFRSRGEQGAHVLLDTYGELAKVYCVADVVVIGGAFDRLGGQNLLQPLAHGKPTVFGPNMTNFRDTSAMAIDAGAALVAATPDELATALRELLEDEPRRRRMGAAAATLVATNVGASRRYVEEVLALIS